MVQAVLFQFFIVATLACTVTRYILGCQTVALEQLDPKLAGWATNQARITTASSRAGRSFLGSFYGCRSFNVAFLMLRIHIFWVGDRILTNHPVNVWEGIEELVVDRV
jgi:hypothetical protein